VVGESTRQEGNLEIAGRYQVETENVKIAIEGIGTKESIRSWVGV